MIRVKRIQEIYPTLFTWGNLLSGALAAYLAAKGLAVGPVLGLMAFSNFLDILDGLVARYVFRNYSDQDKKSWSDFGTSLDGCADIISYGMVGSAVLAFAADVVWLPLFAVPFLAAMSFRLSRGGSEKLARGHFAGLPSNVAGIALVATVGTLGPLVAAPIALLLSVLMVTELPYPHLNRWVTDRKLDGIIHIAAGVVAASLWPDPVAGFFLGAVIWHIIFVPVLILRRGSYLKT
jgi:phosphatidylserine synthase